MLRNGSICNVSKSQNDDGLQDQEIEDSSSSVEESFDEVQLW